MAAVCAGNLDIIKLLLRHGANVDAVTMVRLSFYIVYYMHYVHTPAKALVIIY